MGEISDLGPVPIPAGGLLIFGSYLAHRLSPDSSNKPPAAIYATVSYIHLSYINHPKAAVQRDLGG